MWLESYRHGGDWTEAKRPDKCKVIFSPTTKEGIIAGTTFPGYNNAWRTGAAKEIIEDILDAGWKVVVGAPRSTTKLMIDKFGEYPVEMTEPDENGIQWNKQKVIHREIAGTR
jgi:hypothetical protein